MTDLETLKAMLTKGNVSFREDFTSVDPQTGPTENEFVSIWPKSTGDTGTSSEFIFHPDGSLLTIATWSR